MAYISCPRIPGNDERDASPRDRPLNIEELEACARGLGAQDWHRFADRVADRDPVLGTFERLHADAADGDSPNVQQWPWYAAQDAQTLHRVGITTVEAAREYWRSLYG